jgi:hypothetical protein
MTADYVTGLAEETFKQLATARKQLIDPILNSPSSFDSRPPDAPALAGALENRPDVQAQLASVTGYTPSRWILERELDQVEARRAKVNVDRLVPGDSAAHPYKRAADSGLMGLCFSGGGIRSATFNLGILQGLAELDLLKCFDYLSTVSGGGYIHQWLAAWSMRGKLKFEEVAKQLIPLPEKDNPGTHPEPIRWLRRYSNYLTPEKGILSADTWVAIAIWLRNTLLNQIILISGLFFLVLLPHLFTFHSIIPQHGPAAAAILGVISYLSLMVSYFVAKNLALFTGHAAGHQGAFGPGKVQRCLVLPLLISALLLTLLLPMMSATFFGFNLVLVFLGSTFLLFALALAITFGGGAPLSILKSHQRTAQYDSLKAFWKEKPKCFSHVKLVMAVLALLIAALFAASCGAGWIAGSIYLLAKLWAYTGSYWGRAVLVLLPPLVLAGALITMLFLVGFLGRTFEDARREWLSSLSAWMGLYMVEWILFFGFSLFGHWIVWRLWHKLAAGIPVLVTWLSTSLGGLLAGKSAKTSGAKNDEAPSTSNPAELLAVFGPYSFIAGLIALISFLAEVVFRGAESAAPIALVAIYLGSLGLCLLFAWRVDINEFSLHAFYRNRLSRCYLGASNIPRHPNPFTGFDEEDAKIAVSALLPGSGYHGPFPIFCTALNLTFGEDLAWQERKAASFVFTPLYSGYDVGWTTAKGKTNLRFNGYVETSSYAYPSPGIHINTAAAISGAAVSPNMGYHSSPATAFLLTVFNARLGWWLRNPRSLTENGARLNPKNAIRLDSRLALLRDPHPRPSPQFSLLSLVRELLGMTSDSSKYVYLSDGGHFDNMGLYELVRRRCRYIVICDAEDDGEMRFDGIGMAIRKCRIDFGAEVALDLRPLQHIDDAGNSGAHCVVGTIRYPEDKPEGERGVVVYIKASITGDEPGDILNYKKEHSSFPHDTTLNQWFTESQFESYRRLGHHVAYSTLKPARPDALTCTTRQGRTDYFSNLRSTWAAFTPEMKQYSVDHSARYRQLLQEIRTDAKLAGLFDMMFDRDPQHESKWKETRGADVDYAVRFSSELIEFIFIVYLQLQLVLPENLNHPFAMGWLDIFKSWVRIDVIQDGWKKYGSGYTKAFQIFVESEIFAKRKEIGLPKSKQ